MGSLKHSGWLWGCVLLLCVALFGWLFKHQDPDSAAEAIASYQFDTVACNFSIEGSARVSCYELRAPRHLSGEAGIEVGIEAEEHFVLPVTVIHSEAPSQNIPLLYFSGGPGAGAQVDASSIHSWLGWHEQAGLQRDLVLMDRRATGLSYPRQNCEAYDRFSRLALKQNLTAEEELRQSVPVLQRCFEGHSKQGFKLPQFGTKISSRDAFEVMSALDYRSWHVFGVSYGSRLAMVHAASYPQSVKKVVLDSIYPLGKGGLALWPELLEGALQRYFAYCDTHAECRQSLGGPAREVFWSAMASLKDKSERLYVDDWYGADIEVLVNDQRLLAAVFSALYDVNSIRKIAPALHSIVSRSSTHKPLRGLRKFVTPFVNYAFDPTFNPWVYWAVECREAPLESAEMLYAEFSLGASRNPLLAEYLRGGIEYDVCRQPWLQSVLARSSSSVNAIGVDGSVEGVTERAAEREIEKEAESVASALKAKSVLLLAGELDPITPAAWAESYRKLLPKAHLWQLSEVGHAVLANNGCVHSQLEGYLSSNLSIEQGAGGEVWRPEWLCGGQLH